MASSSGRTSRVASGAPACARRCWGRSRGAAGSHSHRPRFPPIRTPPSRGGSPPPSMSTDSWPPWGWRLVGDLHFVIGGASSGKSGYAVERTKALGGDLVTFVATARPGDAELDARIAAHRRARPRSWRTMEADADLADAVARSAATDVILLDSLTLWGAAVAIAPADVWAALWGGADQTTGTIVRDLRLTRVFAAALVGGSLAVAGALLQGLLRNPLADPYVTGTSAGASLSAVAAIALGAAAVPAI